MSNSSQETLWHYTSMKSMLQIFQNKTLRFSSATHLNDSEELTWVEKVIEAAKTNKNTGQLDDDAALLLSHCIAPSDFHQRNSPLVASFSMCHDKLSQWRAYADDGRGVAIGFDKKGYLRISIRYTVKKV